MDDCESEGDLEVEIQGVNIKKVVLPDSTFKENIFFPVESTIEMEKTKCLKKTIYDPSLYAMVILGLQQTRIGLEDNKTVRHYLKDLASDIELEIVLKGTPDKDPRPIKPEQFKVEMKGSN